VRREKEKERETELELEFGFPDQKRKKERKKERKLWEKLSIFVGVMTRIHHTRMIKEGRKEGKNKRGKFRIILWYGPSPILSKVLLLL